MHLSWNVCLSVRMCRPRELSCCVFLCYLVSQHVASSYAVHTRSTYHANLDIDASNTLVFTHHLTMYSAYV